MRDSLPCYRFVRLERLIFLSFVLACFLPVFPAIGQEGRVEEAAPRGGDTHRGEAENDPIPLPAPTLAPGARGEEIESLPLPLPGPDGPRDRGFGPRRSGDEIEVLPVPVPEPPSRGHGDPGADDGGMKDLKIIPGQGPDGSRNRGFSPEGPRGPGPEHEREPEVDLAFAGLHISNPKPHVGEHLTATVQIRNDGADPVQRVFVVFFLDDNYLAERFVDVGRRGTATAQAELEVAAEGPHHIHVVLDPDNGIHELDERNNIGEVTFNVAGGPGDSERTDETPTPGVPGLGPMKASGPSIDVTAPKKNAKLFLGDTHPIQWTAQGPMNNKVEIERFFHDKASNSKSGMVVTKTTDNDGTYSWKIPSMPPGKYSIVVATVDGLVVGESGVFDVNYKQEPKIKVITPSKGTVMKVGKTFPIQWTISGQHDGKSKAAINIANQDTGMSYTIGLTGMTSGMPSIGGLTFQWPVAADMGGNKGIPGGKYVLEVSNVDNGVSAKSDVFEITMQQLANPLKNKSPNALDPISPEQAAKIKAIGTYKADIAITDASFFGNYFGIVVENLGPETVPKHLVPKIKVKVDFGSVGVCEFPASSSPLDFTQKVALSMSPFSATKCPAGWYPSGIKFKEAKVSLKLPPEIIDSKTSNNSFTAPYPTKSPWLP